MPKRVVVASGVGAFVIAATLWVPALAVGQAPSRDAVQEAARKASFRTEEESTKVWEAELARKKAEAVARVYDPSKPLPSNPPKPRGATPTCEATTSPPRIRPCSAPATSRSRCTRRTRPSAHSRLRPTPTRVPIRPLFTTIGKSSGWRRGRVRFDRTCAPAWSSARRRGPPSADTRGAETSG